MLAIAMDVQQDRAKSFIEENQLSMTCLVDSNNLLGELYNFTMTPNGFLVDPEGVLCYQQLTEINGGNANVFSLKNPQVPADLGALVSGSLKLGRKQNQEIALNSTRKEQMEIFRVGVELYRCGNLEEATEKFRKALSLDPSNFVIRKQIWAIEHPEKFYPGIDFDWQKNLRLKDD